MIGKTIVHVSFGEGVIVKWNDKIFSVDFGTLGIKQFDKVQSMPFFDRSMLTDDDERVRLLKNEKVNSFLKMTSQQRLRNLKILDTVETKLRILSEASEDGFIKNEIENIGEQILSGNISGPEYLNKMSEIFYPILVDAPDKICITEFLTRYRKQSSGINVGDEIFPDDKENAEYKEKIVWKSIFEIRDRIIDNAKSDLFLRMSARQWLDNWEIFDTTEMKLKMLYMASKSRTLKAESFHVPETEKESVKLLGELIASNDVQQQAALFNKFHAALQLEIVEQGWNLSQSLNYSKYFPKCFRMETDYCEGKPWPSKNNSDTLDKAAYCPRTRRSCMESEGARIWPQNNLKTEQWTLLELFAHEHIVPVVSGLSNPEEYVPRMAGWLNRINEIREKIRCSSCNSVMISNKKYSMNFAAYNATVFDCAHGDGHDHNVYLSHCWACRTIIDSRDNRIQDKDGYYLCLQCGNGSRSGRINPGDICPQCGAVGMKQENQWNRIFQCARCKHTIIVPNG